MSCGLTNLSSCLPEAFFDFITAILNSTLEPLMYIVKTFLIEPVNVNIFQSFWIIIIYIISLFYGLFLLFAGFNFLISGYDSAKRENAKQWLSNIILMIIFIQSSFFVYNLVIELGSLMTVGVLDLIPNNFFYVTGNSFSSIGLQLSLLTPYISTLIFTIFLLALRYLFVSVGVVFFPFAIFFYFIPSLQAYGKMILNVLAVIIFVTFFDAVILFGASALMQISIFQQYNLIIATTAFLAIDLLMLCLIIFAIIKAAFSVINSDVGRNIMKAGKYLV